MSNDQSPFAGNEPGRQVSFEEFWNSDYMASVRKRMLNGEALPECLVCDNRQLGPGIYRDHFNTKFGGHLKEALLQTGEDGRTNFRPISLDYRFSNLCNFKCRMCGPQYSKAWVVENKKFTRHEPDPRIAEFQQTVAEAEFVELSANEGLEEIYWAGGEPLLMDRHWETMEELVRSGRSKKISVRYNTNLSKISWRGRNLYKDFLKHFYRVQVGASIDAAGDVGEYLRSGLVWDRWLANFKEGMAYQAQDFTMLMDVTLTLPGLIHLYDLAKVISELDCKVYPKNVAVGTRAALLSPLVLSRPVLNALIDSVEDQLSQLRQTEGLLSLLGLLDHLRNQGTFEEEMGNSWVKSSVVASHLYLLELERRRPGALKFEDIINSTPMTAKWWREVQSNQAFPVSLNYEL